MALKDRMWIILVLGLVGLFGRKVTATPGRVGCFYDLQLCESNELCYNDSLFGTCVAQLTDAVSYADLSPAALSEAARVLQYLIETGYKWPDSYTQCVVGKYLQSAVTNEPYDPQVCEYLKQILTVIDQARNDPAAAAPTFPQSTDVQVPVEPLSHGEFMSKTDGKADFDVPLMDAAPSAVVTDTSAVAPINIDDAASYAALQQYLQTLAQQQPEVPVNVEKKSGPTEATTAAPEVTPATPTTNISDQALQSDAQAFDNLFAFLTAANADSQVAVAPQTSELTAVPMDVPEVVASDQQPMPMRVPFGPEMSSQEFQGFPGGAQFVPDFSARPPPGMFNNLDEMLLAQQMVAAQFAPQNMPQIDPRMLMDPTMMQSQMDPRMMDPRMMAQIDPRIMARMDPQMMQMDPRMMAQMDPRMMGQMDPRMMSQIDPRMLDPRMMAQMDPRMMAQLDPRMMPQMDPRMMDPRLSMPQVLPDQFPFAPMPTKRGDFMAVPPMDLFYQRQPPMFSPQMMDQRMFDPMFMPPQMPPMDMFTGFPQPPMDPSQWAGNQLQMSLPAGFAVIEPVLVDTNTSDEAIKRLFAESGEQSGDAGNGSEGPSAQSKKDQEYKSLLPSNENLQSEVVEDVTVKIVKGSLPDTVVPPTDTQIKGEAHEDDEYVFLMTEPQLSYEEARFLLNWLRAVLSLPVQTFYDLSVTDALLTFRINPALQNLNATYIAQTFGDDELRSAIRGANGLEIKRAGVGHYRLVEAPGEDMPLMQFEPTAVVESMEPAAAVTAAVSKADKEMARKYDVLDPTMAFIVTDPPLDYKKAKELLIWLAGQLQVPPTIFTDLHIEGNQLVFRVSSLFDRINASRVVEHLSGSAIQSALRQQFDVEIIRTGIGDKVQVVKADLKQRQNLLIGLIAVACVAAILITLGIIYFVRRNLLIKKKLQGLGGDVESSKEYEVRRNKEKEAEAAALAVAIAISQAEAAHAPVVKTIA